MSAIAPPPIAGVVDEAYEVRRESALAIASFGTWPIVQEPVVPRRDWPRSAAVTVALSAFAAILVIVAWRAARAIAPR